MSKERILVVEDERLIAEDIKDCLEKLGYSITSVAVTGEEAVRKAEEDSPDLALMDIRLEGQMDGVEAAERIMSCFKIPVVYMTAHADENILRRARATSPFGYVLKPFEDRELDIAIQMAMYRHRAEKRLRESQEELQKSENLFRNYFELGQVGMAITSLNQEWLRVNERICEILGYSRKELEGMTWTELTYPDDLEPDLVQFRRLLAGEIERYSMDKRFIRKDGTVVYTHLTVSCQRRPDRSVEYVIASVQDISDRKRGEEELRLAKEEAEEATKLKDKFVSLVAHDLRGPLTNFVSFLNLFQDESYSGAEKKKLLEVAQKTGQKMFSIINDLLDISRLKTGKIKPRFHFFDLSRVVAQLIEEFTPLAEKKKIRVASQVPENSRLYADRELLAEVVRNLLSNSVKFCREGDSITLFLPEGNPFVLAVADTGIGISPEKMKNIFKYEEKTSSPGTAGESGTGLGLPLAKDIMEAQGGKITVESVLGKGCVFFLHLPRIKPLILVVDNDPMARQLICSYVRMLDVEIREAEDGEKALEFMRAVTPHIIITGLLMPVVDGYQLIERVRKDPKTKEVPVVVVTSEREMKARDLAYRLGANDFITKPIAVEELNPRIRRFLA